MAWSRVFPSQALGVTFVRGRLEFDVNELQKCNSRKNPNCVSVTRRYVIICNTTRESNGFDFCADDNAVKRWMDLG